MHYISYLLAAHHAPLSYNMHQPQEDRELCFAHSSTLKHLEQYMAHSRYSQYLWTNGITGLPDYLGPELAQLVVPTTHYTIICCIIAQLELSMQIFL